jgi:hypothetical protein
LAERVFDIQTPQDEIGSKKESILKVLEDSKEKESMQSPKTVDLIKPTPPLTRSLSRNITYDYKLVEETQAHGQLSSVEKIHTSPREGEKNVKWINKKLREDQDLIIQLREEKRISEIRIERHFHTCGPTIRNSRATLTNAQSKLRRNALLFRQVRNLKRQNFSLRKVNMYLKQRIKVDDEARGNLDLLAEVAEI